MYEEKDYVSLMLGKTMAEKIKLLLRQAVGAEDQTASPFLPMLPPDDVQVAVAGKSGYGTLKDAFDFIDLALKHYTDLSGKEASPKVLDFGCGWGRLCQVWSTYIPPSDITGCDVRDFIVDIARKHAPQQKFVVCSPRPPLDLPSDSLDIITAYSVFSHLSEDVAQLWVDEFERVLRPGGMAFITTRPRAHILVSRANHERLVTDRQGELNSQDVNYAKMFEELSDFDDALARYDRGEFVYIPTGGGRGLDKSFYGESVVPLDYVSKRWAGKLMLTNWIPIFSEFGHQPMIVLRKRPS